MEKRNIFEETMQGIDDMVAQREGKTTLRQHEVELRSMPKSLAEKTPGSDSAASQTDKSLTGTDQ